MAAVLGTLTLPLFTRYAGTEHHLGDVSMDLTIVDGKAQAPTAAEFIVALKNVDEDGGS